MKSRSSIQCLNRWSKILKPGLIKGPWTVVEDQKLSDWVKINGPYNWAKCSNFIEGRSGKQCRERWFNSLSPGIKKGNWSAKEDYQIFQLYNQYGSKWAKIASYLNGRTENSIKNRFYSTLRRIAYEHQKKITDNTKNKIRYQKDLLKYIPQAIEEKSKKIGESNENQNFEKIDKINSNTPTENNNIYKILFCKAQHLTLLLNNTKAEVNNFDLLKSEVLRFFPNLFQG